MNYTRPFFSSPTVVNLELTDVCNETCRHCYNFWREDNARVESLTKERLNYLIDKILDADVFHVVLTGGEPMAKFDLLEHAIDRFMKKNVSVSCNSNLTLATKERVGRLRDVGLDHILTSLCSHDQFTNDFMTNKAGSHRKIVEGIENSIAGGIRVSVNMVVSRQNKNHVYDTGKFSYDLGCQRIFGTRAVPSVNLTNATGTEYDMTKEDALNIVDQLLKVKKDTGILVGTLVSYPLCLLGDLEKYRDFVGRGCPAQSGHLISINATGDTHACVHEEKAYGNIFESDMSACYEKMRPWHDGSYYFNECKKCDYLDICQAGCRMSAQGFSGKLDEPDTLMEGMHNFVKAYKLVYDENVFAAIDNDMVFKVPKRLRFRREKKFYLVNIRWANTIVVPIEVGEFLHAYHKSSRFFTLIDFGVKYRDLLASLFFKDAIIAEDDRHYDDVKCSSGLGIDMINYRK